MPTKRRRKPRHPKCLNCGEPFVYPLEHWHCVAVSCDKFKCKRSARASLKGVG